MNIAIILAAGTGSRLNTRVPKQFLIVREQPLFLYSFNTFARRKDIHQIVIVVLNGWRDFAEESIMKQKPKQNILYVKGGRTRQLSILNGLHAIAHVAKKNDVVIIHDAARPLVPDSIITNCIKVCARYDGAMPAISVKDTVYQSINGDTIMNILKRSELFAGQTPESFHYGKYVTAHQDLSNKEIANTSGSSEVAFKQGLRLKIIPGSEKNIKITTANDLKLFESLLREARV